jgi:hypothetical protein
MTVTFSALKKTVILFFFIPLIGFGQNYVDLINLGYSNTFSTSFKESGENADGQSFFADLNFPIELNEKYALITGVNLNTHQLPLYPNAEITHLYSLMLKLGLATTHSKKWSSTLVFLPKLASDYNNLSSDDLYLGGYGILKYQKSDDLLYKLGAYGSTEAFGVFFTPIVGLYYTSPNGLFEMDLSLPISADINYTLGNTIVGIDYFGIGRSFHLDVEPNTYVEQNPLEFSSYIQFNAWHNSILVRAKVGYSSYENEVYADGDKLDVRLSAFNFGDDRTQLNPDITGGFFIKIETLYRFHIGNKKRESKN